MLPQNSARFSSSKQESIFLLFLIFHFPHDSDDDRLDYMMIIQLLASYYRAEILMYSCLRGILHVNISFRFLILPESNILEIPLIMAIIQSTDRSTVRQVLPQ